VHLVLQLPDSLKARSARSGDMLIYEAQGELGDAKVTLEVVWFRGVRALAEVNDELDELYRQNKVDAKAKVNESQQSQGWTITHIEHVLTSGSQEMRQMGRLFAFPDGGAGVFLRTGAESFEAVRSDLEDILDQVRITLNPPDPQWTDAEVQTRIQEIFTPAEQKNIEVFRTKHYLILTDASAGKSFGKELEDIYSRFQKMYSFADVKGTRLLPIYLFKMRDGYIDFYARYAKKSREAAARSGGHSWKDYYATAYTDPHASVHSHECAHQIVKMRLGWNGAGSWYQEGIAEYFEHIEKPANLKNSVKSLINRNAYLPWRKLLAVPSLLQDAPVDGKTGDRAGDYYSQAATVIWFFHKGPYQARFLEIMKRLGRLPHNDVEAIETQLKEITGQSLEQLEEQWKGFVLKL
jgi:hypothetical protein